MIKIAVPNKGRLHEPAIQLMNRAGIAVLSDGRRLFAGTSDPEIQVLLVRAIDIPELVAEGVADLGITGYDVVVESGYPVELLLNLDFGKARLVLAVPENSGISRVEDLPQGTRVATEFPNISKNFFRKRGVEVRVVPLSGACEIAPHIGLAETIVDLVSTGTSLKMNKLVEVETVLETSAYLIGNREAVREKQEKVEEIVTAFSSVLAAKRKKLVMMNVPKDVLEDVKKVMPGMAGPTVAEVASEEPMYAVNAVVEESEVYSLINRVKKLGARDILVLPIERIIE
ncbi:MAG: ATP phosphoribosyltransferase [Euryarchaeota archaeon]|nr:ATP phosphoribosyltransferase [Euryarchaeota archaeon]